jgi:hypothetical protein
MMSDRLLILAAALFAAGLLAILWVLYRTIRGMRQRAPGQPAPKRTATPIKVSVFVVGVALVMISQLLFWLDGNLAFFAAADESKLIGKLRFETDPSGVRQVVVHLRRADSGTLVPFSMLLKSETMIVEAEVIRFSQSYSLLGIGEFGRVSALKVTPLSGDSSETPLEKRIYPDADQFWELLDGVTDFVPGIETIRFLSEPIPFETGAERLISLSQSQVLLSK